MRHKFSPIPLLKSILLLFTLFVLISCDQKYAFKWETPVEINIDQPLPIQVIEKQNKSIDKIIYKLDGQEIKGDKALDISAYRLGKHSLEAEVFYGSKSKVLNQIVTFMAAKEPKVYNFKIINTYPHDVGAYTQGLEYHNGFLYESTGKNGSSSLRKVDLKTGKVLQQIEVPSQYFAEGMTILHDKIYQLTWRENTGFIYNLADFSQIGTFAYQKSKEGWGLTHDSQRLIKTDGTEKVWFLDPETQKEMGFVEAYTNQQSVPDLNELEFIEGKIFANVYQKNIILILNPENGAIEGVVDLNDLEKEVKKTQNLIPQDEVLNGIAYDESQKRIFVTGKHWGKLFEIQLIERP
jgi:glutamine cyclotransferase